MLIWIKTKWPRCATVVGGVNDTADQWSVVSLTTSTSGQRWICHIIGGVIKQLVISSVIDITHQWSAVSLTLLTTKNQT
jgi:hypothetical protein